MQSMSFPQFLSRRTFSIFSKEVRLQQPQKPDLRIYLPPDAKESAYLARRAKFDYLQSQAVIWTILRAQSDDLTGDYLQNQLASISAGVFSIGTKTEWKIHRMAIRRSIVIMTAGQEVTEDYLGQYVRTQLELHISNDCSWNWVVQSLANNAAEDLYMYKRLIKEAEKQLREEFSFRKARKTMRVLGLHINRSQGFKASAIEQWRTLTKCLQSVFSCRAASP